MLARVCWEKGTKSPGTEHIKWDSWKEMKAVLGNAAALQHSFKLVLLSQAADNYQFSPGIYLHAEFTLTIAGVSIPAVESYVD